ncbi:MAG: hypothetical protein MUF30_01640 [Burkholderiales bacterium]|nr:hypothetical protein [Burkholderiales bacterium]
MTLPIVVFVVVGAVFGLVSWRWRHHFSEGSVRPGGPDAGRGLDSRLVWVVSCTLLWPLLLLTGALGQLSRRALARQRTR